MEVVQAPLFGNEQTDPDEDTEGPRWVVQVNEAHLFTYGGNRSEAADWWFVHSARPGIVRRTTHLILAPPGALLYVACEDREEAEFVAGYMHGNGCSAEAVKALRIGHQVICGSCGQRKPFWHRSKRTGVWCRPCFKAWVTAGCPIGWKAVTP